MQKLFDGHLLLDLGIYDNPTTDADCLLTFDCSLVVLLMALYDQVVTC
jgi:hypothetical protein